MNLTLGPATILSERLARERHMGDTVQLGLWVKGGGDTHNRLRALRASQPVGYEARKLKLWAPASPEPQLSFPGLKTKIAQNAGEKGPGKARLLSPC